MSNAVIIKLNELGYTTIPDSFYSKVYEWKSWYQGNVKGFHNYTVQNGERQVKCRRYSLGMGKKLCEDWANLLMNEKVKITLEGQKEQDFIDLVLTENNFTVKANEMQELKSAMGTVAYVPRVIGQEISESGDIVPGNASGIVLDYVTIENIYPLSWQNGYISECAFSSEVTRGGKDYLYLQIHRRENNGNYVIENRIYRYDNEQLADEQLVNVKGFENIPPVVHTGSDKRQFVIDRPNIANNVNYLLPTGIAIYANAIDVLQGVDIAYDSYVNEFKLGKKRIMVKPSAAQYLDGTPAFDPDDVVFYVMPEDTENGAVVTPIDMTLRTAEHNTGIQDQLNILSSKCGFGETYYRFDGGSVATATQVISENSTMFRTIKKMEIVLEQALVELCRILLRLGNTSMNAGLNEDVEISIDFDDSIIEDKQTDFSRDMQLLSAGIMNDWEFRMKWMNEDEATAKAALPKMQDMTTEQQNEVE
jgi:A118 family predicted phage portal protein|uniref:Portal protein n=1 Tax=Siphoviridae sp. ctB9N2 TaxID=2826188 RepID=A0A8S5NFT0_9CAUD|nr:MAG TPA: portal protein [Siphoviridae sp. ctB9N2]